MLKGGGRRVTWKSPIAPREVYLKFTYTGTYHLTATNKQCQVMCGNSPYDPDITGTGYQPPGYDDWCLFYTKYCVVGSKISVEYQNDSVTTSPVQVYLLPSTSASAVASSVYDTSGQYNPRNMWNSKTATVNTLNSSKTRASLKNYMSSKKFLGRDYQDTWAAANYNALPTAIWYWHVGAITYDAAAVLDLWVNVKITYYTIMYHRNEAAEAGD